MLSCKHTVQQGSDYIENELSFWRKVEMKMHLMICVHCRRYVKQLKQTVAMLGRSHYKEPTPQEVELLKEEYQKVNDAKENSDDG